MGDGITFEEFLAEVEHVEGDCYNIHDDWPSAAELATQAGLNVRSMNRKIELLKRYHRLEVGKKWTTTINGCRRFTPCYRIKPQNEIERQSLVERSREDVTEAAQR